MLAFPRLDAGDLEEAGLAELGREILLIVDVPVPPGSHIGVEHLGRSRMALVRQRLVQKPGVIVERDRRIAALVDRDQLAEVRRGHPQHSSGTEHSVSLAQNVQPFRLREVFDHVLGVDMRQGPIGQGEAPGHVEEDLAVDQVRVEPARQGVRAAAELQAGSIGAAQIAPHGHRARHVAVQDKVVNADEP